MKEKYEYACSLTAPLSQLERDELSPQQIIDRFKEGNLRFIQGKTEVTIHPRAIDDALR